MQPHVLFAQQMPLQQFCKTGSHVPLPCTHVFPPSGSTPPSGTGGPTSVTTHCAMWLCAVESWNGSQNAGKLESTPLAAIAVDGWTGGPVDRVPQ